MALTITEALAEIKTIDKRLAKKREFVQNYLFRQERFRDPLEKEGGSVEALRREMQSISDLEERKVAIRRAVAAANENTPVTVCGETRTIAWWLTWRREVAPAQEEFYRELRSKLDAVRRDAMSKGLTVTAAGEAKTSDDVVVNISEQELAREMERLEEVLGTLDGVLSLKNATVLVNL